MSDRWREKYYDKCEELNKAESAMEFTEQWYAERIRRVDDLIRDEAPQLRDRYCAILANGTAEVGEPATYAQQLNTARYLRQQAEGELELFARIVRDVAEALGQDKNQTTHDLGDKVRRLRQELDALKGHNDGSQSEET